MSDIGGIDSFMGMKVIANPWMQPEPALKLSSDFKYCSNEFRSKINKWLLDTFGVKEMAYIMKKPTYTGVDLASNPDETVIVMHPDNIKKLKMLCQQPKQETSHD